MQRLLHDLLFASTVRVRVGGVRINVRQTIFFIFFNLETSCFVGAAFVLQKIVNAFELEVIILPLISLFALLTG